MYKINTLNAGTKTVAAAFTAVALMLVATMPAHALVDCNVTSCNDASQSVSGDCSAIINQGAQTNASVSAAVSTAAGAGVGVGGIGVTGNGGDGTGTGTANSSASNATNQANVGPTFAPDCSSVTNVTQQAAAQAAAPVSSTSAVVSQVKSVPSKGVNAGAGGAVGSVLPSLGGLLGSVVTFGLGALRLRQFNQEV